MWYLILRKWERGGNKEMLILLYQLIAIGTDTV